MLQTFLGTFLVTFFLAACLGSAVMISHYEDLSRGQRRTNPMAARWHLIRMWGWIVLLCALIASAAVSGGWLTRSFPQYDLNQPAAVAEQK